MDGTPAAASLRSPASINFPAPKVKWAEVAEGLPAPRRQSTFNQTAELRPLERSQTDEKDLMPLSFMRAIEKLAIYDRLTPCRHIRATERNNSVLLNEKPT